MPGFPGVSGDVLFILRIAQNKTIERGVDVEPFTLRRLSKFFRESQPNAGAGDVQGQSTLIPEAVWVPWGVRRMESRRRLEIQAGNPVAKGGYG